MKTEQVCITKAKLTVLEAADNMDWMQPFLNQSPPCFHMGPGVTRFCGRAERWHHDGPHRFISFREFLLTVMEAS